MDTAELWRKVPVKTQLWLTSDSEPSSRIRTDSALSSKAHTLPVVPKRISKTLVYA